MRASLHPVVARGIAVICAAVVVGGAHPAHAGINVCTSHGPPDGPVSALAIDPITPGTLYAGTEAAGVFKSTNGGGTWSAANTGLTSTFVNVLAIDLTMPTTLYAGTNGGVFAIQQFDSCVGDCDDSGDVGIN